MVRDPLLPHFGVDSLLALRARDDRCAARVAEDVDRGPVHVQRTVDGQHGEDDGLGPGVPAEPDGVQHDEDHHTWANVPDYLRGGGDTWVTGSYAPGLDLVYFGVAQAKPWVALSRDMTVEDPALYTNSTVALRLGDGELEWHFQHVPGETLDLDELYERVLVDVGGRKAVFSAGKHGLLWELDRESGEFLGHKETVYQNVFDHIDPETGAVTYRQDIADAQFEQLVPACPSTAGGKNWHPMGYHPESGLLVLPLAQSCMELAAHEVAFELGSGGVGMSSRPFHEMPGTDGGWASGRLRRRDVGGGLEHRAAADGPDRRPHHRRGTGVRR